MYRDERTIQTETVTICSNFSYESDHHHITDGGHGEKGTVNA
ncbi:hypothetical protein HMPREF3193_01781 [Bifidobacterium breve]|nr:hypothetical protein HMPREF1587_00305 [Bifidobacterium breve JCP7499]KWZ83855.1 hypothetical protein HMPREF3193_01781 [Bifidobacterium breve]